MFRVARAAKSMGASERNNVQLLNKCELQINLLSLINIY